MRSARCESSKPHRPHLPIEPLRGRQSTLRRDASLSCGGVGKCGIAYKLLLLLEGVVRESCSAMGSPPSCLAVFMASFEKYGVLCGNRGLEWRPGRVVALCGLLAEVARSLGARSRARLFHIRRLLFLRPPRNGVDSGRGQARDLSFDRLRWLKAAKCVFQPD